MQPTQKGLISSQLHLNQSKQSLSNQNDSFEMLACEPQRMRPRTTNSTMRQIIAFQVLKQQKLRPKQPRSIIFTRQSLSALHKKQQNMRKRNYQQADIDSVRIQSLNTNGALIVKQASLNRLDSQGSNKTKRPFSSASSHQLQALSKASSGRLTTTQKQYKMESRIKMKKAIQFRSQNPMVIYPFESHLKTRRIDDNPKVLSTIITKKYKVMEKKELYQYLSNLMVRRK